MKEIIKKLVELAQDYVVFGIEIGLPDTHNHIRGGHQTLPDFHQDGDLVNIYFDRGGEVWMVEFNRVEISSFSYTIKFPYSETEEYLTSVYDSAKKYLHEYLLPNIAKCKISTMKERHTRIKKLEREIKTLKKLV